MMKRRTLLATAAIAAARPARAQTEIYAKRRAIRYTQYRLYYMDLRPDNFGFA